MTSKLNNKNDLKKIIMILVIGIVAYLMIANFEIIISLISKLYNAMFPFILGIVLAFILNIPMMKIETFINNLQKNKNKKIPTRGIAITLSLIIFITFIIFVSFELVPELVSNIESLIKSIPGIINEIKLYLTELLSDFPDIQKQILNIFNNNTSFNDLLMNLLNNIVNGSIGFISNFVSSLITIFTSLVFAIYMLAQKESLIKGIKKIVKAYLPEKSHEKIMDIAKLSNQTFTKFVSGQCLEALILGCIFFVILTLFQFPYALLISVITTITALIPIFGALIAMVIGAILIATINPLQALLFIGLYLIIQQIEGNLIYPRVVGKSVGLSPIWTLLAVTVGGSLFGIVGMLIGLPLASILYAIFKKDLSSRLKQKNN